MSPPADAKPAAPDRRAAWGTIRTLLPYLWPAGRRDLKLRVLLAVACLVAAKVATVYIPIFYKLAVDHLTGTGTGTGSGAGGSAGPAAATGLEAAATGAAPALVTVPVALILAYGLARVLGLGFAQIRDALFARVGAHAVRTIAMQVFRHLHSLSMRFHLSRQTGGLTNAIGRGTAAVHTMLRFALFNIVPTLIELLLVLVILWQMFDWRFAVVTLATVGLYIWFTIWVSDIRIGIRRDLNQVDDQANTRAVDSLLNFETVKYFSNEAFEADRYDTTMKRYERVTVRFQVSLSALNGGQTIILAAGLTLIMYMTALGIVNGTMTVGDFVLVNTYMIQLSQPLGFFGFLYREVIQALTDMERMFSLGREQPEIRDRPDAGDLAIPRGEVRFEEVQFRYDPDRQILHGVSFVIPAGHTVAVVGPSGAGKSTLTRLLFRFYDPSAGRILIDGQDIATVRQRDLRRRIGIVPQDTVLFNDTIGANILYGRPEADEAEMRDAARLARIDEFIESLPKGYDTMVGERGLKLSGGERQRVAIARTILKNPPILVLDEATSALDSATEQAIQANLRDLARNRTTLVIAHRLSTVIDADEILVMEAGRIRERGSHGALLAAGGLYAEMWARQSEDPEAAALSPVPPPADPAVAARAPRRAAPAPVPGV